MTEINSDHDGPYPSANPPTEGTQVTDASSTSSTKEALNILSNAMVKLTTEMSQLRQQQQNLQQTTTTQREHVPPQYYPTVHSYVPRQPAPMTQSYPHPFGNHPTPIPSIPPAPPLQVPITTRPRRDPQTEKSKKAFYGV